MEDGCVVSFQASHTLSEVDYLALELLHHLPSEKAG